MRRWGLAVCLVSLGLAACRSSSPTSPPPGPEPEPGRPQPTVGLGCSNTTVAGLVSLPELGPGTYLGFQGGLYPRGWTQTPGNDRYGVSLGAVRDRVVMPRAIQLAGQAGIGWLRMNISHALLQPTPDSPYRFEDAGYDAMVAGARSSGLQILCMLAYVPAWNSTAPPNPSPGAEYWDFPPRDLHAWADYVFQTVSRYKNQIHYWEVWNEPDLRGFWAGTPAQYAKLLAVTYDAIKRADPQAKVLLGGLAMSETETKPFLTAILSDPNYPAARYFDIMNVHSYSPKEIARRKLEAVRQVLARYGAAHKPLWITEAGYASDPALQRHPGYQAGKESQAQWLRDMLPFLLQLGAEKVFWFQLYDYPEGFGSDVQFRSHGLIDNQGQPKPSYFAYKDLIQSRSRR